jgi:hypothetical protein
MFNELCVMFMYIFIFFLSFLVLDIKDMNFPLLLYTSYFQYEDGTAQYGFRIFNVVDPMHIL